MAAGAYVLINVMAGKAQQVKDSISILDGVVNVDTVAGPFDIIVSIESPDYNKLAKIVMEEIQNIDGVEKTLTCNVLKL